MHIAIESPDQADVIALIADLDAYQDSLYPPESRYAMDLSSLTKPNVRFAVARDGEGRAQGCGAIVFYAGYGELKRMYVRPESRGQGVARAILTVLEACARQDGMRSFKLESGPHQGAALAFYASCGYATCGRYGDYKVDPNSVFMGKDDTSPAAITEAR
ncbi:GNAT family N-acetyltransferase [Massilia sp. TSP1-1-2]|uniref:GNAT family N-acetyltransferase n=1 Tax=unclassified Massilia TaxID=2609279 RepID=UPI003CF35B53